MPGNGIWNLIQNAEDLNGGRSAAAWIYAMPADAIRRRRHAGI